MFNLFKKKEWINEAFSVISGNTAQLHITIRNFPCRKEKDEKYWHYAYSDFGNDFISELSGNKLSEYSTVASELNEGKILSLPVKLKDLSEITVEIQGRSVRKNEFYSDLADAVIDAMERNGIKP
jgi:hypothetical protein